MMYLNGDGIKRHTALGLRWLQKAAVNNHRRAQYVLGNMYKQGFDVEKDYYQAFHWFRQAADGGYAKAQFQVGLLYERGLGVSTDRWQAKTWLAKARKQGVVEAKDAIARIDAFLSHDPRPKLEEFEVKPRPVHPRKVVLPPSHQAVRKTTP